MESQLLPKLVLAVRLGIPVPEDCKILRMESAPRGYIDLVLEDPKQAHQQDPATAIVIVGFYFAGVYWPQVFQAGVGVTGSDTWDWYNQLVARLPPEYVKAQEEKAQARAARPVVGAQLGIGF